MKDTVSVPETGTKAEPKPDVRKQLAEYVAQQPASKQAFHKSMGILEVASLVIVAVVFAVALYLSITWKSVPGRAIAAAWFCFPLSFTLFLVLVGVHAIVLRAFPPTRLLGGTLWLYAPPFGQFGKALSLRVGRQALGWGWGTIVIALVSGAFWGLFAYGTWTLDLELLKPLINILGIVLGVAIAGSILYSIYRSITRFR